MEIGIDIKFHLERINMQRDKLNEFPVELGFGNYLFTNDCRLFRPLRNGRFKELRPDDKDSFKIKDMGNKIIRLNRVVFRGIVDRMRGKYKGRKRLFIPYERYECDREGNLYLFERPETKFLFDFGEFYGLINPLDGKRHYVDRVGIVSRTFSYNKGQYADMSKGFTLTRIKPYESLAKNPKIKDATFVNQHNTIIIEREEFKHHNLYLPLTPLPIYLNLDTGDVWDYKNDTKVKFEYTISMKEYSIKHWNFKMKRYETIKFIIEKVPNHIENIYEFEVKIIH